MEYSLRGKRACMFLSFVSLLMLVFLTTFVNAVPPFITKLTILERGDHTVLELEISHEGQSEVDQVTGVAVRLDGGEPIVYDLDPQLEGVFTVEIDLGVLEGRPIAELSLYCTLNGWTPWFEPFEVPEFPRIHVMLLLLLLTLTIVMSKREGLISDSRNHVRKPLAQIRG